MGETAKWKWVHCYSGRKWLSLKERGGDEGKERDEHKRRSRMAVKGESQVSYFTTLVTLDVMRRQICGCKQNCVREWECLCACKVGIRNLCRLTRPFDGHKLRCKPPPTTTYCPIHTNTKASNCLRTSGLQYISSFTLCVWKRAGCGTMTFHWREM